jgi:RNA polymerase sigma factor (sigma-70 family)
MSFPETRLTLIQRIATGGDAGDWRQFFEDYWRPIFRFSVRQGRLSLEDAEEVASHAFETLLRTGLLSRWISNREARLRTLLCAVVRNLLSNRSRLLAGRERSLRAHGGDMDELLANPEIGPTSQNPEAEDAFFAAWAEELLETAMEHLLGEFHRVGKGDHFRVLHGRICESLSFLEIADELKLPVSSVENYYRRTRHRLGELLERLVRQHVERYTPPSDISAEFRREWQRLGEFLGSRGGIESALLRARAEFDPVALQRHQRQSIAALLAHCPT